MQSKPTMGSNLLATKFHQPPAPAHQVQRSRLMEDLDEGLANGRPLTLISAPAGFGKSTCASGWASRLEIPAVWLSLEKADDDPARFFTYFVAALQKLDQNLGAEIVAGLRTGSLPPLEVISTLLINAIAQIEQKFVLVLDDFQVIQDDAILEVLERLVTNRPAALHLVLVTREDPLLPLARWRARNQMTEIRASDLRFKGPEINRFLKDMVGLSLSEDDLNTLENRTEGWAVGLQLAGLSMRGRRDPSEFIASLSGSHRYILSYLTEEVINQQPEDIQEFLLQTSILNRLNGDLCQAVSGRTDSHLLLERLYNANLFLTPLDDEQEWYRYHHLFADLLRNQLSRIQKEQVAQLHQRASHWYAQAGMPGEAIEHALNGGDYDQASRWIEAHAREMVMQGYAKTVDGWIQALPREWNSPRPKTNLAFAWMHLLRGSYAHIAAYLEQALAAIAAGLQDTDETADLHAEALALQSNLSHVQGKATEGARLAHQALQLLQPENHFVAGMTYVGLGGAYRQAGDYPRASEAYQKAILNSQAAGNFVSEMLAVAALTLMAIQHGQLHFAAEVATQGIKHIEKLGGMPPPIAGTAYGTLGIVHYEWDQLEKAREYFQRSIQLNNLSGHTAGLIYNKTILARLLQAEGDLAMAARFIQEAADLMQSGVPAWLKPEVIAQQVRVLLAQGNLFSAESVLRPFEAAFQDPPRLPEGNSPLDVICLAHLRLRLHQALEKGQPEKLVEGIAQAGSLIEQASQGQRVGIVLQAILLRAQMQAARGDEEASLQDLDQALRLAEPEDYQRTFVDEGPLMAEILQRSLQKRGEDGQAAYIRKLLTAFGLFAPISSPALESPGHETNEPEKAVPNSSPEPLIETLSERELEVLRLMAQGMKYEEIAEQLVVTLNTVRFHVKGIYGKLNVNNRTKAIELARQLGLL